MENMDIIENELDSEQELEGSELLERWQQQNRAYHFEGDSGLDKLEKLVGVLGYKGHGFKHGSPIESFLSDNPGACGAIVEFISEWADRQPGWREALQDVTDEEEE